MEDPQKCCSWLCDVNFSAAHLLRAQQVERACSGVPRQLELPIEAYEPISELGKRAEDMAYAELLNEACSAVRVPLAHFLN